jgi:integrase/recombinase XerD
MNLKTKRNKRDTTGTRHLSRFNARSYGENQQSGTPEPEDMETLLKSWAEWIEAQGFAPGSVKDHRQKLQGFLEFLDGKDSGRPKGSASLVLECDRKTLSAYQSHLFEIVSKKTGKKLSCNSQINRLTVLKNFYRFLHQTGRIARNPTEIIVLPHHPKLIPPVLLKSREMKQLLETPDLGNPLGFRDRTIMEVFFATGMRLSELTSSAVEDLNFEESLIHIKHGKGQKQRLVPMGEAAKNWLAEYLQNVRPILAKSETTQAVFLNRFAHRIDKNGWQKKLTEYVKAAGLKKNFTTHCFRHQLATAMLERGADTRHIQEILGHETLKTTQRYLHVVKAELKRIHAKSHPRESTPFAPVNYQKRSK